MIFRHLAEPLPSLQTLRPELPAALDEVIQQATAKEPAQRFADVLAQAAAVRRSLGLEGAQPGKLDVSTPLLVANPYKGLRAFQQGDAADFFGREQFVERLQAHLLESSTDPAARFLAVIGPSGSGKSSVVKAGLIPALRREALPGSSRWYMVEMTPGPRPLEELEAVFLRIAVNPPPTLLEQLQADERGLFRAVNRILPDDETELLLFIDQFEELFTLVEDEAERSHFLESLRLAVTDPRSRLRVVITLRADFYDQPLLYPAFGDLLSRRMVTILPLSGEELTRAITGPAERVGASLEPGLASLMVAEVQSQPGLLPLLQYALTELFERRQGRRLTHQAYQASGGVVGALAQRADALYTELDEAGQVAVRRLFLRLVTLGEGAADTRRRVLRPELLSLGDVSLKNGGWSLESIMDTFGQYRLLTFDRDPASRSPTVEVAHEALLGEWGRLRQWLAEDREFLLWQQRLRAALYQWQTSEQDEGALLRGAPLVEAENWFNQRRHELSQAEGAFIQAGLALRERRAAEQEAQRQRELEAAQKLAEAEHRRAEEQGRAATKLRQRALWLAGALVVAGLLAMAAVIFGRQASQNAAQAVSSLKLSESQRLAAEANNLLYSGGNGELAALLSIRALNTAYTPQADIALQRASKEEYGEMLFAGHTDFINWVTFSPDGKYILTASNDQTARLWEVETGQEVRRFSGHEREVEHVAFSPDGRYVLTTSQDNTARLWETATGQTLQTFAVPDTENVYSAAFSPDGQYALLGSQDGAARLWDLRETGREVRAFLGHEDAVYGGIFSSDGRTILTGSLDGTMRLWEVDSGREMRVFEGSTGVVAFSPDGRYVLTSDTDGANMWDLRQPPDAAPRTFSGHTADVYSVAFSPDGQYVLTASHDGTARLWDVATGQEVRRYSGISPAYCAAFSPDGQHVLVGSADHTARLWPTFDRPDPDTFTSHTDMVQSVAVSPDGRYLLSGGWDKLVKLWDIATAKEVRSFSGHNDWVEDINFSPDGKTIFTSGAPDQTARLWAVETGEEILVLNGEGVWGWMTGLDFSPDGRRLLTASLDGTARVWDAQTGQELQRITAPDGSGVWDADFSPDGKYILTSQTSGSSETAALLWDAETGQEVRQFAGHTDWVAYITFSPDGKTVLTSSWDETARLWDTETGQELRTFVGHTDWVNGVAFSPDGRYVLTASNDNTARLWDAATGQQLRTFGGSATANDVAFSPDGQSVFVVGGDKTIRRWDVSYEALVRSVCARLLRDFTSDERQQYGLNDEVVTCPTLN